MTCWGRSTPKLRGYAAHALRERGVELRLGVVGGRRSAPDCVMLADGERGCRPGYATSGRPASKVDDAVVGGWGLPQGRGGRTGVEPDLRVEGHPEYLRRG